MAVIVHHGDSRDVLKTIADASIDSCVCDPPYALVSIGKQGSAPAKGNAAYMRASAGFMGKTWDTGETEQPAQDAESALPLFVSLAGAE
jgi:site-specific DNA-methyltransferase (adenine-specific)